MDTAAIQKASTAMISTNAVLSSIATPRKYMSRNDPYRPSRDLLAGRSKRPPRYLRERLRLLDRDRASSHLRSTEPSRSLEPLQYEYVTDGVVLRVRIRCPDVIRIVRNRRTRSEDRKSTRLN